MKKKLLTIVALVLMAPWVTRAQSLENYGFSTGVDASKWITLSSSATQLFGTSQDDQASSLTNIGFSFLFGATSYTQFWVSTNGIVSFSSSTSSTTTAGQFTSSYYNTAQPKICGVARDLGTCSNGYIKYELVGTAPERVLVIEFKTGYTYTSTLTADVNWQVQLHEDSAKVVIVYGSTVPATSPQSYQTGLGISGTDFCIIDPVTHTSSHHSGAYATTTSTWHGANRYYSYLHPNFISCPNPTGIAARNITSSSADITWNAGGTESEWELVIGEDTYYPTDTFYTVTGLDANTPYAVSVRAICGSGDTSLAASASFRTACDAISNLPYSNDFEDEPYYSAVAYAEAIPNCWHRINDATVSSNYYPYLTTTASYVHSGNVGMYWYQSTSSGYAQNEYAILPPVDLDVYDMSDLTLSFWAKTTSTSYHPQPIVGVMSDPTDASTFTAVHTFTATDITTDWQMFVVSLASYTDTGSYIAIKWPNPNSTSYMAIDDIFLTDDWCDVPGAVSLNTSANEVTLSWESNGGSSFTVFLGEDTVTGVTDTFYTFIGLTPDSVYHYGVATECATTISNFMAGTVHTDCIALTAADLPYSEDFESYGSSSTSPISSCWTKGTSSTTAYPYPSTTVVSGTRSLYFYGYNSTSSTPVYSWAALPPIDDNLEMSDLMMTFKVKRGSTASTYYTTRLYVGVAESVNNFTNATAIESQVTWIDTLDYYSATANSIHDVEVSFANYLGTGKYVVLYVPIPTIQGSNTYCYNYAYVDDVVLRAIPTCFWPTDVELASVGTTDATINWTPDSRTPNPSGWNVEYGLHGFTPGEGTTQTVTDTTILLTGLTGNTQYDIYISANCGGDVSDPVLFTFYTECDAITTLPYTQNFDGVTGNTSTTPAANNLPNCWDYFNHGTRTNYIYCPYVYNSATYAHSGSNSIRFYSYAASGDSNQYLILPLIDSTLYPINTLQVRFWLRGNSTSTSYHADVIVGVMTNPANEASFVPIATVPCSTTTYTQHEVLLGTYTGDNGRIAFKFAVPTASSNYEYGYVDDITIEPMPTCPSVEDIDVTATAGAAMLTWNYQTGFPAPDGYEVVYDSIGGTTPTTITVTEPNAILTNLEARTTYKAYVSAQCTDGDGRMDSIQFTTGPAAFIDLGGGTGTSYYLPIGNFYNYSYTQQIVTAAEMGGAATLTGIDFEYAYSSAMTYKTNCTIYLANTTTTSLSSAFVTYNASTFVPVYTGSLNCTQGWNHFQFTTPFQYNGTGNLLIVVHDNSGDYNSSSYVFATHTAPSGYGRYVQNDSSPYTISSVSGGTAVAYRANMHIYKVDNNTDITCGTPIVITELDTTNNVHVRWVPGYHETSWDLDYHSATDTNWVNLLTNTSLTEHTILLEDLQPMTEYTFRVTPHCTDTTMPGVATYTTPCGFISLPYMYGFEDMATGTSSTHPNIPCWNHLNNGTSYPGYPYVYASAAHTGSRGLYWYMTTTTGTYGDYSIVVLPPVDTAVSALRLKFWAKPTSTSYAPVFQIGVMTDPTDPSTFQNVSTINIQHEDTEWKPYTATLTNYTGNGHYVAVRANRPSSSWYAYTDDFTLEVTPNCPMVESHNVATTVSAARIEWTTDPTFTFVPDDFEVRYGYVDDSLVNATVVYTSVPEVVLTSLTGDTTYMVSISSVCDGSNSSPYIFTFSTMALPCLVWDTTSGGGPSSPAAVYTVGTPATTSTNVMPVNGGYNYSYCNHLIPRSAITAVPSGTTYFSGIDFEFAGTSPMVSKTNCTIYMCHTTMTTCDAFANPNDLVLVYEGPLNCTTQGWNHFDFNRGTFAYNGTSNIIVAIVDNSGATDANASFYYEAPGSSVSHRVYRNDAPYTFADLGTVTASNSMWRSNMRLTTGGSGGGSCLTSASCAAPNVTVKENNDGDIVVSWIPGYQETAWDLAYRMETDSVWTTAVTGTTNTSYTFLPTDLQPMTEYVFRVTPNCTDTVIAGTVNYTTPCGYITIPYTYGFENLATGSSSTHTEIPCWTHLNNGSSYYGYPYVYASAAHTGSRGLYWYLTTTTGTYGDYEIIVLPPVDTLTNPINTLQLSFWAKTTSTSYAPVFLVGVMTNPSNASTFQTVGTVNVDHSDLEWRPYEVVLSSYTGNGQYVAIRANRPSSAWYAYTDDITLELIPDCPRVTGVFTSNITTTDVTINWDSIGDYDVEYGPAGFAHGNGTTITVYGTDSVDVTGLTPNTAYDVYVRAICGNSTGNWSFIHSFRTACETPTLPYFENFDSYTTSTTAATGVPVPCWDATLTGTSTYQTGSYVPQIYYSSSYAHSGNYSYRLYGMGYHMLPEMPTSLDSLQLSFWDYTTGTYYGLEVGVMEGTTFVPIQTINTASSSHAHYTIYFGTYTGTSRIIAFRNWYTSGTSTYYSYHYLDDVKVEYLPTCPPVVDINVTAATTSSITIDWTDQGSPSTYEVEYTYGNNTNTITVGGHPTTINGLLSSTAYTFRVRPICSIGDTGDWTDPYLASTDCDITVLPYSQNFNTVPATTYNTAGQLPPCWEGYENATTGTYIPHVVGSSSYWYSPDNSPSLCMTSGTTTYGGDTKIVRLPLFNEPVNNLSINFWMATESSTNGTLSVGYLTDSSFSSFVAVKSIPASTTTYNSNGGHLDSASFSNAPATARYIAFKWVYTSSYYSCCIDNVSVTGTGSAVTCPAPTDLTVTGDYQSATVTWNGTSSSYEVALMPGTWSEPASGTAVSGNTVTLSGLEHSTSYSIGVRSVCADGTTSDWVLTTFVTDVLPCTAPTNVTVSDITYTTATLTFTPGEGQSTWVVRLNGAGNDVYDTITTTTKLFTGLFSGTEYQASVRALCGADTSGWSAVQTFSTLTCAQVTGVTVSNITGTTAYVSWTPTGAASYTVDYGYLGTSQGQGTSITVSTNSVVLSGLEEETDYDVYVRGVCADGIVGLWSTTTTFTTTSGGGPEPVYYNITVLANPTEGGTTSGGGPYIENSIATVSVAPNNGWTFVNWQDGNTENPRVITVTSDMTFTANLRYDGVGIDEVTMEDVSLFPNPATSTVTVMAYGMDQVSLIDLNGRTVMTQRVNNNTTTFDVSNLAKGTYFVRIVGEQATAVRKLIVK